MESNKKPLRILQTRRDFLEVKKAGQRFKPSSWLTVSVRETPPGSGIRFGWVIPKHVGIAVIRNRFKRWLRIWAREKLRHVSDDANSDICVVFLKTHAEFFRGLKHEELLLVLERFWRQRQVRNRNAKP